MDGNVCFQIQGQTSLFSNGSTSERNALILRGNERTLRIIISTTVLEGQNRTVYRKSEFIFGDAAPDTDQQLLAREGQWVYTLDGDWYYLPENKCHYLLAFFQLVIMPRMMRWGVSRCTESVHVGFLTLGGFTRSGPPRNVIGLQPGNLVMT